MEHLLANGAVLTEEMIEKLADEWENDTWDGHLGKVCLGRPRVFNEEMETVSFRLPKSRIAAIELAVQQNGETKSDFFRNAIDNALGAATA